MADMKMVGEIKIAGAELFRELRRAIGEASANYERASGTVVTRIEAYRCGADWCVEILEASGQAAGLGPERFVGSLPRKAAAA
jgi:hypothetical protein